MKQNHIGLFILSLVLAACIVPEESIDATPVTGKNTGKKSSKKTESAKVVDQSLYDNSLLIPAEGNLNGNDGSSWLFSNKGAAFSWTNEGGDYIDKNLVKQGTTPWAIATIEDTNSIKEVDWNVTDLVQAWLKNDLLNKGFIIRHHAGGAGSIHYYSREHADSSLRPKLVIEMANGTKKTLEPLVDTRLVQATKTKTFGKETSMTITKSVGSSGNRILIWFDIKGINANAITKATLTLTTYNQFSNTDAQHAVYAVEMMNWDVSDPVLGIANNYPNDRGITAHPDVLLHYSFDTDEASDGLNFVNGNDNPIYAENIWKCSELSPSGRDKNGNDTVPAIGIPGLTGVNDKNEALCTRVKYEAGPANTQGLGNTGMSLKKLVKDIHSSDQIEELYVRHYLFLGDTWGENILNENGKRPGGIGGRQQQEAYAAGWGGRRTNGANGWSARGGYKPQVPYGNNPLEGYTPLSVYIYHADQPASYGDNEAWTKTPNGLIKKGRWYCIEQYVKMNTRDGNNIQGTSGNNDGIIKGWVDGREVFSRTNLRFTDMNYINIDAASFGLYYGGPGNTPYDQHMAIDDIVISKSYIGCKNTGQ